jgi:hypothetical protein
VAYLCLVRSKGASVECPNCKLLNPPGTLRCDCGYNFATGEIQSDRRTLQTSRPANKALSSWSILRVGLLVVVVHQILLGLLSVYSIARGKTLPADLLIHVFYILCWPFAVVSALGLTKNWVLIVSWFAGTLFWASVVCFIYPLYHRKCLHRVRGVAI